jgi:hypothetical protein
LLTASLGSLHSSEKFACRFGFEFKDVSKVQDPDEEVLCHQFSFAGSRWKIVLGVGVKEEDGEKWVFCELARLSSLEETQGNVISNYGPMRNVNKKHMVSYQIVLLPSAPNVQHGNLYNWDYN